MSNKTFGRFLHELICKELYESQFDPNRQAGMIDELTAAMATTITFACDGDLEAIRKCVRASYNAAEECAIKARNSYLKMGAQLN